MSLFLKHVTHHHLTKEEMKGFDSSSVQVLRVCLLLSSIRAALDSLLVS